MLGEYPLNLWKTSTLGSILRVLIGGSKFYLQYISTLFGICWLGIFSYVVRNSFEWIRCLPLIILVSIVTITYGWIFDYSMLIIGVIWISVLFYPRSWTFGKVLIFSTYWISNLLVIFWSKSLYWFWWFPIFLLVWYLISNKYLNSISTRIKKSDLTYNL